MPTLTLELPRQKTQTASNLRRWAEVMADRELARFSGRVETDRYGHKEVWLCDASGTMSFFVPSPTRPLRASRICPDFPKRAELR